MALTRLTFDLHTHHERCNHAVGNIRDYIETAISNGFDMIGISDHSPHFYSSEDRLSPTTMAQSEFSNYVQEVLQLKEEYKEKIDVLLGVESDFFKEYIDIYKKIYQQYPFDYIIGSVHYMHGSMFGPNKVSDKHIWHQLTKDGKIARQKTYYRLIQQSAQSGLFQILGHIDWMKQSYEDFSNLLPNEIIDETLQVIAESNMAIEVNTSGARKGLGWFPDTDILERAHHYGVDVTFGSDAHSPKTLGHAFEKVRTTLKEIGYDQWCYFKNKEKHYTSL